MYVPCPSHGSNTVVPLIYKSILSPSGRFVPLKVNVTISPTQKVLPDDGDIVGTFIATSPQVRGMTIAEVSGAAERFEINNHSTTWYGRKRNRETKRGKLFFIVHVF
jgi:hypothetical protein